MILSTQIDTILLLQFNSLGERLARLNYVICCCYKSCNNTMGIYIYIPDQHGQRPRRWIVNHPLSCDANHVLSAISMAGQGLLSKIVGACVKRSTFVCFRREHTTDDTVHLRSIKKVASVWASSSPLLPSSLYCLAPVSRQLLKNVWRLENYNLTTSRHSLLNSWFANCAPHELQSYLCI